jgi:hypothetical protein
MRWPMRIMDRNVHARLRHCLPWPMRFLDAHDFGQQIISSGAPKQNLFAFGEKPRPRALCAAEIPASCNFYWISGFNMGKTVLCAEVYLEIIAALARQS